MNHENIVKLHDVFMDDEAVYLVLDYCTFTLYDALKIAGSTKTPNKFNDSVFKQLVSATKYIHDMGYIHNDISPRNIMIVSGVIKLIDFGSAKKISRQYDYDPCPTESVKPPELSDDRKVSTEKVDVWSLGKILYACPLDNKYDALILSMLDENIKKRPDMNTVYNRVIDASPVSLNHVSMENTTQQATFISTPNREKMLKYLLELSRANKTSNDIIIKTFHCAELYFNRCNQNETDNNGICFTIIIIYCMLVNILTPKKIGINEMYEILRCNDCDMEWITDKYKDICTVLEWNFDPTICSDFVHYVSHKYKEEYLNLCMVLLKNSAFHVINEFHKAIIICNILDVYFNTNKTKEILQRGKIEHDTFYQDHDSVLNYLASLRNKHHGIIINNLNVPNVIMNIEGLMQS